MADTVFVVTYVTPEKKAAWADHAEALHMSLSEYCRTMVQAGRSPVDPPTSGSRSHEPQGERLETAIREALRDGPKTFDELVTELHGDVEGELDATLQAMDTVTHVGRTGRYQLVDR